MAISKQSGSLTFDNALIVPNMLSNELLRLPNVESELWSSNDECNIYRIKSLKVDDQKYVAAVTFLNACITRVTISPETDISSWDEVTEESIQRDGEILKELMKTEFGNQEEKHSFSWGKVELWQDAKNAFNYSVTVSYILSQTSPQKVDLSDLLTEEEQSESK